MGTMMARRLWLVRPRAAAVVVVVVAAMAEMQPLPVDPRFR